MGGTHRMVVKSEDKKGNVTYVFYDFNDPDVDAKAIDNGKIDHFELLYDQKINEMIDASGVRNAEIQSSRWTYALNEATGRMDYGHRGVHAGHLNKNTFYIREMIAYNLGDIGNYS